MSIFIPPNNQPESVVVNTSTYTIPSGKFARVTLQAKAWAAGFISPTGNITNLDNGTTGYNHVTQDTDSDSMTVYLPAGTVIASVTQNASDSESGASKTAQMHASGSSYVNITIDGTVALSVYATAVCYAKNSSSFGSDYWSATVTGGTSLAIVAELFSEIS